MRYNSKGSGFQIPYYAGARFALHTALHITGAKGEIILAGGVPGMTSIVGGPNNYKTAITIFLQASMLNAVNASTEAWGETHDTESTLPYDRLSSLASGFKYLPGDTFDPHNPLWTLTSNATYYGDEWLTHMKTQAYKKVTDKAYTEYTFLLDSAGKPVKDLVSTVATIDTMSKLMPAGSLVKLMAAAKEGSDTNMFYMELGKAKDKMLMQMPRIIGDTKMHFIMAAHVGEKKDMSSGFSMPEKKLQHMRVDKKVRGVPESFYELPHIVFEAKNGRKLMNQNTKMAEFPAKDETIATDLNIVKMIAIRNKLGVTGAEHNVVISQTNGVHEGLTDFMYLRDNNKFGLEGNDRSYNLVLYPEVSMSRTKVRDLLEGSERLCRAMELTADYIQLVNVKPYLLDDLTMTMEELYKSIVDQGYSWDKILDTRGWWTPDQYKKELAPYLSIIELLKIAKGIRKPYFDIKA